MDFQSEMISEVFFVALICLCVESLRTDHCPAKVNMVFMCFIIFIDCIAVFVSGYYILLILFHGLCSHFAWLSEIVWSYARV